MPEAVEDCVESTLEEDDVTESEAYSICWSKYNDGDLKESSEYEWGPYSSEDDEEEDEENEEEQKDIEDKSKSSIAREIYNKYDEVDKQAAVTIAHTIKSVVNGGIEDPLAVKSLSLHTITGDWKNIHPSEKTKEGRDHLRETYKYVVEKIMGQGNVAKTLSKSNSMEKVDFTADFSGTQTVFKAGDEFVIWGPASVEVVDKEGDRIHAEALQDALPQLLKRGRLSLEHSDQLVGEIIESYELEEAVDVEINGETYEKQKFPTDVMDMDGEDPALYVCGKIYNDTRQSKRVRESIEEGELNSYSISGEALVSRNKIENGEPVNDIVEMDLSAVTVCEEGMNQHANFATVKKDGYTQVGMKEDDDGNLVPNLVPKEEAEKIQNGDYEKDDDPCWEGYEQQGMKEGDNGEMVPNCIPKSKAEKAQPEFDKSPTIVNIKTDDGRSVAVTKSDDSANTDEHPGDTIVITKSSDNQMSNQEDTSKGSTEISLGELKGEFEGVVKDALSEENFAQEDDILTEGDVESIVEEKMESEDGSEETTDDSSEELTAGDVKGIVNEVLEDDDDIVKDDEPVTADNIRDIVEDVVKQEEEDEEEEEKQADDDEEEDEEKQGRPPEDDDEDEDDEKQGRPPEDDDEDEDEKAMDEQELAEALADMSDAPVDDAMDAIDELQTGKGEDGDMDEEDEEKQGRPPEDEEDEEEEKGEHEDEEDEEEKGEDGDMDEEDEEKGEGSSQYSVSELQEKLPEDVFDAVRGYIGEDKSVDKSDEEEEDPLGNLNIDKAVEQAVEQQFNVSKSPGSPDENVEASHEETSEGGQMDENPALSIWSN